MADDRQHTQCCLFLLVFFCTRSESVLRIALANRRGACAVDEEPVFILSRPPSPLSDGLPVSEEEFVRVSLRACVFHGSEVLGHAKGEPPDSHL